MLGKVTLSQGLESSLGSCTAEQESPMLSSFAGVLLFMVVGIVFIAITLLIARLVRPKGKDSPDKYIPYECGEVPVGSAWIQFNIRFYVIALIFIIFDVEIIFLLPWVVVFKSLGAFAFIEGLIFIAILVVGLAYVWRKGDLAWVKPEDLQELHEKK
jgi:NADH-quinone oxidoreductase subunit A